MRRWIQIASLSLSLCIALSACERGPEPETEPAGQRGPAAADPEAVRVPLHGAKIKGSDQALVTIVEFSDYACPFCKKAHETIESLLGGYEGRVRLAVFENPLPFHTTAKPAARWAFAAGQQGKYWQARDLLFEKQRNLDEETLAAMARELGLDADRLQRDRDSAAAERHVQQGLELGAAVGVTGTPAFFINGQPIIGAQSPAAFRAVIDGALTKAEGLVARGVARANVYAELMKTASATLPKPAGPAGAKVKAHAGAKPAAADGDCHDSGGEAAPESDEIFEVEIGEAPVRGAANAKVTLVVFTDFECPFCEKAEATLRELEDAYQGKLRIVYKAYPLPFHAHARSAARAALAAHKQGKFWEYRDVLFQHRDALDRASLLRYAATLGLDTSRFERDMDDRATEAAIAADEAQVEKLGVRGTPAFFVNGRKVVGAQPAAAFRTVIDRALAQR